MKPSTGVVAYRRSPSDRRLRECNSAHNRNNMKMGEYNMNSDLNHAINIDGFEVHEDQFNFE